MASPCGSLALTSVPLFNVQNVGKQDESKTKHQAGVLIQASVLIQLSVPSMAPICDGGHSEQLIQRLLSPAIDGLHEQETTRGYSSNRMTRAYSAEVLGSDGGNQSDVWIQ